MNLRQMAEAAGFWGWTVWPEELKRFAVLIASASVDEGAAANYSNTIVDTSLTDEPPYPGTQYQLNYNKGVVVKGPVTVDEPPKEL